MPGGHPSNYVPGPALLNFSDRANNDELTPYSVYGMYINALLTGTPCQQPLRFLLLFWYYWGAEPELIFFLYAVRGCTSAVYYVGFTQQVHIGRRTAWQGGESNFLSLGPDVISLTSILLTTGLISPSYLGTAITSTCGPFVANHPQMGHSSETPPNVASF